VIEGLFDRYVAETAITSHNIDKADWHAWLKETFLNNHKAWMSAPGVQPLLAAVTHYGPGLIRFVDDTLEVLMKARLPKTEALRVLSALTALTLGNAILQTVKVPSAAYLERMGGEKRAGRGEAAFEAYPYFQSVAEELSSCKSSIDAFEFQLDLLLDSIG